jgi:hypothetical protein
MRTLATDSNNDMFLEKKGFAFVSDLEAIANIVERRLKTQLGELQYNTARGIDWFDTIFASASNAAQWITAMKSAIRDVEGVTGITSFEYSIERNVHNNLR